MTKDNEKEEDIREEVEVPNIEGLTIKEAEKVLKESGLGIDLTDEELEDKEIIVNEQLPKSGIKVYKDTKIFVNID